MKLVRPTRLASAIVVALAVAFLTGCSQQPGTAAVVGGVPISTADVDLLARVQCADLANQGPSAAGSTTVSVASVRIGALSGLIQSELNAQFAAKKHASYDNAQLQAQMAQAAPVLDRLPEADRVPVSGLIESFNRGQLQIAEVGRMALLAQGVRNPTIGNSYNAGQALRDQFAKKVKISVNPEYAPGKDGIPGTGDGSMSVPVSDFAKQSASGSPRPSWAIGLPPNQRCG